MMTEAAAGSWASASDMSRGHLHPLAEGRSKDLACHVAIGCAQSLFRHFQEELGSDVPCGRLAQVLQQWLQNQEARCIILLQRALCFATTAANREPDGREAHLTQEQYPNLTV